MNDPEHTKAYKPEQSSAPDETVDDVGSQSEHPSEDVLLQLATGRLDEANANCVQTHLASCSDCAGRIHQLRGHIDSFANALASTASPHGDQTAAASHPDETVDHSIAIASSVDATSESTDPTFGDYELISEIARGGMGVVHKARQKSLNRIVALKMIKSGEFANQEQVDRFYKEAEAAAQLTHPGIVPVHEVGASDGQHYFTMGFVDGESLADRLRNGPLPPKEAARYAKSIAEAVAYAHSKGVIHRDLKPGNVLITKDGALRITDFGLAKRIEEDSELTSTGQVLGTPSYMPPEQAEGKLSKIGPAADIYSIGATLYCMLVGRPPFQAANLIETLQQVLDSDPVSLSSQNKSVPADLETLCLKCLEKKPNNRYQSSTEVVDELNRFQNGEPIVARPIGKLESAVRWCKRKPAQATALIALGLIPIIITGAFIRQSILSRQAAIARVDTLLNATPATIPVILEELDRTVSTVESRLRDLDSQEGLEPAERIRVSLALLPYDSTQLSKLKQRLYECTYDELEVLLDRIRDHGGKTIVEELWTAFRANGLTNEQQFRTGIALAALDPDSEQWKETDYKFLVNSMLAINTIYQPAIRRSLAQIASKLVNSVRLAYESAEPDTLTDESSANAIVDFAAVNTDLLSELSVLSTPKQHSVVFPVVEQQAAVDESIVEKFVDTTKEQPQSDDGEPTRIKLGKRRAGSAINLVRLGKPDEALEVLRVKEDPESMTQFVHGCKDRGVTVTELLDLLNRATSATERYGILLALGEFVVTDIPEGIRSTWVEHLKELYANDPSSGIHGASGWLLRRWGYKKEADAIEQRTIPYRAGKEWFTVEIKIPPFGIPSYFTFVVFQPGQYQIGSSENEQDRDVRDEQRRVVKITRPFAVLDREVTRGEFQAILNLGNLNRGIGWMDDTRSPMAFTTWYMAVSFCRSMTTLWGLSEEDQAYADPKSLDRSEHPIDAQALIPNVPRDWPIRLDRSGFRLPTAAEFEVASRGESWATTFNFGSDRAMLRHYSWYQDNSEERGHHPRELRPSLRGLFDMHGNMFEWCHDWYGRSGFGNSGPIEKRFRLLMGGGFRGGPRFHRSAFRLPIQPSTTNDDFCFRVVLTLDTLSSTDH